MDNLKQIKHLYARAGFGMRFEDRKEAASRSVKQAVNSLFKISENTTLLTNISGNTHYTMLIKGGMDAKKHFLQMQTQRYRQRLIGTGCCKAFRRIF
jgi:hypothetical protein